MVPAAASSEAAQLEETMRSLGSLGRALAVGSALFTAPLVACDDGGSSTTDTATTATTATDATTADTSADDTAVADDTATTPDTTTGPVTWDQVYPIFHGDCVPCHAGNGSTASSGSGGHAMGAADMAIAYQASQLDASGSAPAACQGKKKGECALIRVKDGSMPASGDCAENPPGAKCPTAEEQALIQQWIDDGMLGPK